MCTFIRNDISIITLEQDSLDLSSSDDITVAIERFEKLLGADLKYSDSFKKMKESMGSSSGSLNFHDQNQKSNISAEISRKQLEEDKNDNEGQSQGTTRIEDSGSSSDDENLLYQCLSSTNLSLTQMLDKADTQEQINMKRQQVIDKIKQMRDIFSKYNSSDR